MTAGGGREQQRLDQELVRRGIARSRSHAQSMIASSGVLVNGRMATRPAEMVRTTDRLVVATPNHYVSRAAHKLVGALDDLDLDVAGCRALDAGASTGGFTQVLLERGCREVIAVDVGTDQLAAHLRHDHRVRVWERTNLRQLQRHHVDGVPVELVVADVSFISLTMILEPLISVTRADGRMLLMIKPQFEVGRTALGKSGVVRSAALRQRAVNRVSNAAADRGWPVQAVVPSRLPGPAGSIEFFALLQRAAPLTIPLCCGR
jgi:23S rRNA (cytidine1920-2'-O)/16S rRNA (cytidine1409-2'-O)-methyltransferase